MMAIRLIAMDLDGTALNNSSTFDETTLAVFEKAAQAGIILAAATGRPFPALPSCLWECPSIHYCITSNGTGTYRLSDREQILVSTLTAQNFADLFPLLDTLPYPIEVFTGGGAYASARYVTDPVAYGAPERAVSYVQSTRTPIGDMRAFVLEHRDSIEEMNLIFADSFEKKRIRSLLEQIPNLYVTSSAPHYLEFASSTASKSNAILALAEHLGILRDEILAFGDGENDMDMIRCAGIGVAMGNACQSLKETADAVTGDNDHFGVASAILRYANL